MKPFGIEAVMMMNENNNVPNPNPLTSRPPLGITDETHICTQGKERKFDTYLPTYLPTIVVPWQLPH
jgi:hypothetical protein